MRVGSIARRPRVYYIIWPSDHKVLVTSLLRWGRVWEGRVWDNHSGELG